MNSTRWQWFLLAHQNKQTNKYTRQYTSIKGNIKSKTTAHSLQMTFITLFLKSCIWQGKTASTLQVVGTTVKYSYKLCCDNNHETTILAADVGHFVLRYTKCRPSDTEHFFLACNNPHYEARTKWSSRLTTARLQTHRVHQMITNTSQIHSLLSTSV